MSNMNSHLNFRLSSSDKQLLETAAQLKGLKPNTYARQKLLEAAEKDIAEVNQLNTLLLSPKEWEFFVEVMDAPVKINPNFKKAVKKFRKMFER